MDRESNQQGAARETPAPHTDAPSAIELRDALACGELGVEEFVTSRLARIADHAHLGAFVSISAGDALAGARQADERIAAHLRTEKPAPQLPPLLGMPLAHKDLVDVAGSVTTRGSNAVPHRVATVDDPMVARVRSAGAISLGKTQVPEFGLTGYSENLVAEPARNPLDPSRTPGGSSGGSAAAVAAGMLPFAPASDGGGSIRIPALACGIVGLKPGLGTIAADVLHGTVDSFGAPKLSVSGPLARTAADAALLFDAMAQGAAHTHAHTHAPGDPAVRGSALDAVHQAGNLAGLHVGISRVSPFSTVYDISLSGEAVAAFDLAAARLAERHRVDEATFTYDAQYPELFTTAWAAGLSLLELDAEGRKSLAPLTREFRDRALARPDTEHFAAGEGLQKFAAHARAQWGQYDVVLTPGLAFLPPRVGEFLAQGADGDYRLQCQWAPYTSMVNVAGLPAIAVPMLTLPSGLSMGVQLIGRHGSEPQLLQLAAQLMSHSK